MYLVYLNMPLPVSELDLHTFGDFQLDAIIYTVSERERKTDYILILWVISIPCDHLAESLYLSPPVLRLT